MGLIEQIIEMQDQGIPDEQMITSLQEQGVSPKEITDAINQAQIKRAVSSGAAEYPQEFPNEYPPQPGDAQMQQQEYYPEQSYQENQSYPENQGYYPGGETETIIELAEQVFIEKIKDIQNKVDINSEFKTLSELKLHNLEERLARLESIIDKLQISILEKVGSYGKSLENTQKEMEMMQDSFRKVIGKRQN